VPREKTPSQQKEGEEMDQQLQEAFGSDPTIHEE
jgi:hypothetical protein